MTDEIVLSICVIVYNHENYILEALDSILMQDVKYSYEVLVGEDCSTDNTRSILQQYEKAHPNKIKVFYRENNMSRMLPNNSTDLRSRAKGKYIINLEGDDFWTDASKIEKQIKFLESNPEYIAVAHNCLMVDKESKVLNKKYPECKQEIFSLRHYLYGIIPGQLTTVMYRNIYVDPNIDTSILYKNLAPGDRLLYFVLACYGKVFCMQEKMSAYRFVTDGGSSYSANYKYNYKEIVRWNEELMNYAYNINNLDAIECAEALFVISVRHGWLNKHCISFSEFCLEMKKLKFKNNVFKLTVERDYKRLLKKLFLIT